MLSYFLDTATKLQGRVNSISFLLDIILIALFVLMIILGAKRGFVLSVLTMLALIVSMIAATFLSDALTPQLYEDYVQDRATQMVEERLPEGIDATLGAKKTKEVLAALPEEIQDLAEAFGIDLSEIIADIDVKDSSTKGIAAEIESGVVRPILQPVMRAIVFFALLVILYILLRLVILIVNNVTKLPVLRTANKLLGGIVGGVKGLLLLLTIGLICNAMVSIAGDSVFAQAVEGSYLLSVLNILSI